MFPLVVHEPSQIPNKGVDLELLVLPTRKLDEVPVGVTDRVPTHPRH